MKIAIDARSISLRTHMGGIPRYASALVSYLLSHSENVSYLLTNEVLHPKYGESFDISSRLIVKSMPVPLPLYENFFVPTLLRKEGIDLFHSLTPILPFLKICKYIMTIHEISYEFHPEWGSMQEKLYWRSKIGRILAKKADWLVVPSKSTKQDIVRIYHLPENRISVIYHGVDRSRFRPIKQHEDLEAVKQKYGIFGDFILYVGVIFPKRNLPRLFEAFCKLKKMKLKHKLVLVGRNVCNLNLFCFTPNPELAREVIHIPYVPDDDLPLLYNAADVFVYPSLYEGFGFPPLEAMACGTPVVASNISSLPEIVGRAGLLVNPYDSNHIASVLRQAIENQDLRSEMVRRGLERAKYFSWEQTAEKTLNLYETVLNQ